MAFIKTDKTLEQTKKLVSILQGYKNDNDYTPRKFLNLWDKIFITDYLCRGNKSVAKFEAIPIDECQSYFYIEVLSVHNLLKSSLTKSKKYIGKTLTHENLILRLQYAVNCYLKEHGKPKFYAFSEKDLKIAEKYARPF